MAWNDSYEIYDSFLNETIRAEDHRRERCKLEFDNALMKFGHDRLIPVIMEEEMLNPTNWSDVN
jgi:hypothetical protein